MYESAASYQVVCSQRVRNTHLTRHAYCLVRHAMSRHNRFVLIAAVAAALSPQLAAQTPDSSALSAQIRALQQRVEALERQRARADSTATPLASQPASPRGFYIRNTDGSFQLRLRGQLQTDARMVDGAPPSATTLLVRSARPMFEMTAYRILDARFVPDFGQGQALVQDAHVDIRARPWFAVRAGKFKAPLGLERLQSEADIVFVERGLPTFLVPQRDLGVQAYGDIRSGLLTYALGVFNGAVDYGTADLDNGSQKDIDARLFALPFRTRTGALQGFGVGVGYSSGKQYGTLAVPALPSYRSPAQVTVFSYRTGATLPVTTVANGSRTRFNPQAYWYVGPLGVLVDYVTSSQHVQHDTSSASLTNSAWLVQANVVLTGEHATFRSVSPAHPVGAGGRGAFEIGARISGLTIDDDAFPVFADSATSPRAIRTAGVVFTWYLAPGIKLATELDQTAFTAGAAAGDRRNERAALVRLQHAF